MLGVVGCYPPQPIEKASPISVRVCCPDSQSLSLSVESLREGFAWYLNTSGMYLQRAPQDLRRMRERMSSAPLALVKVGNHPQEEGSVCLLDLRAQNLRMSNGL